MKNDDGEGQGAGKGLKPSIIYEESDAKISGINEIGRGEQADGIVIDIVQDAKTKTIEVHESKNYRVDDAVYDTIEK